MPLRIKIRQVDCKYVITFTILQYILYPVLYLKLDICMHVQIYQCYATAVRYLHKKSYCEMAMITKINKMAITRNNVRITFECFLVYKFNGLNG